MEECVSQVKRESRAIALPVDLKDSEVPPDIREMQVADLGFLAEWRVDLGKRVL
jgi:hypothetical protein